MKGGGRGLAGVPLDRKESSDSKGPDPPRQENSSPLSIHVTRAVGSRRDGGYAPPRYENLSYNFVCDHQK